MIQMKEYIVPHLNWGLLEDNLAVGMSPTEFSQRLDFSDSPKGSGESSWGAGSFWVVVFSNYKTPYQPWR
jgi:hypothetical protein